MIHLHYLFLEFNITTDSTIIFIKALSMIIFYMYFCLLLNRDYDIGYKYMTKIMHLNLGWFTINMILGLMGFGYKTYGEIGSKGFFYAGNETSLLLLVMFYYYLTSSTAKYKNILSIAFLIFSYLLGTKTGMISCLVLFIVYYYLSLKKRFRPVFFLLLFIGGYVVYRYLIVMYSSLPVILNAVKKFNWRYGQSGDILNALLSNRILYLSNYYDFWKTHFSMQNLFFGIGKPVFLTGIEIDFFVYFFQTGLLFTSVILGFYLFLIMRSRKHTLLFTLNLLFLGISFSAGHVWGGVMAGYFFVCINALHVFENKKCIG
ncbi:hypothetical protein AGMMS49928_28320 [Spirochaetia bacterium]|nr:hypothetical protein AGMMS49928_28320 [Spirochaetia bacterium]